MSVVGIYLAVFLHFNHFYEVFIVGLFLVLRHMLGRRISRHTYFTLYCIFVVAGLIGDLLMGLVITKLWRYNYSHIVEYATLYTIIYPFAGIVMVQSYLYCKNIVLKVRARKKIKPLLSPRDYVAIIILLSILLAISSYLLLNRFTPLRSLSFYILASILALFTLSFYSQLHGHETLIEDIHKSPSKILATLLLATYANFLIQEIPNSYGHQWIYTNYPLNNVNFLRIPIVPLLGWSLLLLVPVAGYYLVLPIRKRKPKHSF